MKAWQSALLRNDVHDTSDCRRAIQCTVRSSHNLDPVKSGEGKLGEIQSTVHGRRIRHSDIVNENGGLIVRSPSHENALDHPGVLADPHQINPFVLCKNLANALEDQRPNLIAWDDRDASPNIARILIEPRRRDEDFGQVIRSDRIRPFSTTVVRPTQHRDRAQPLLSRCRHGERGEKETNLVHRRSSWMIVRGYILHHSLSFIGHSTYNS
jgi:hypothetical protein